MLRQYELESSGKTRRVCWLDHEPPLSLGTILTLRGSEVEWTVMNAPRTSLAYIPDQQWQVGGIIGRLR